MAIFVELIKAPLFIFIFSLILSLLFLIGFSKISFKIGLVDQPGGRKKHKQLVPLVGGLGIFCSTTLTFFPLILSNKMYFGYWTASLLLICVCIADDRKRLPSNTRLLIQLFSSLVTITIGGITINHLGDLFAYKAIFLGILSIPFTCFSIIGIINAVNMMDGVDGLTGAVSCVELLMLFVLAVHQGTNQEALLIIAFLGAILAFLLFNFPSQFSEKRKLFLGDAGSMLIGLTLAYLCIKLTEKADGYPPILMVWILALPIMDTIYLIINRKARGISAFRADRRHIHHLLLLMDFTPRQTTLILTASSCIIGSLGILLYFCGIPDYVLFYGFLIMFTLYSTLSHHLKKQIVANHLGSVPKIFQEAEN